MFWSLPALVSCSFPTLGLSGMAGMDHGALMDHSLLDASLPKVSELGLLWKTVEGILGDT